MAVSLALQWTLDQTVDHFIRLGRDVIQAATRDNVQPIALLACERFGATLAICPATRSKVEKLLKNQTGNTALGFIKAQIGYPKGGSAEQLSRSLAGVNFLALAAALISSTDTFEAATALEMMITESATDKTLVPTAYHLKDLLNVLEPRLSRICFMDEILNWKEWWMCDNRAIGLGESAHIEHNGEAFPSADGLKEIVTALRGVYRIGEAKKVTFTTGSAVPWLTAFITWCLGTCPTISTRHGRVLHSQSDIPINIIHSDDRRYNNEVKIEIFNVYNSFAEILTASLDHPHDDKLPLAAGMTTVPVYAKHVLASLDFESGLAHQALLQALPYALKQVRDEIVMACSGLRSQKVDRENLPLKAAIGNPFPHDSVVAKAMATYLSLDTSCQLENLAEGTLISDLPLVSLWLNKQKDFPEQARDFAPDLSIIVADILVLSLFDSCQDSLMVYYTPRHGSWRARAEQDFGRMIRDILLREVGTLGSVSITEKVLAWALQLLRHDFAPTARSLGDPYWGGSSFKGQVVFPKVFEEQCLRQDGYLELFCVPGVLTMVGKDHQPLSLIRCQESNLYSEDEHIRSMPITGSLNLIPDKRLSWRVIALDGYLLISMHWSRTLDNGRVNPYGALDIPTLTIFTDSCQHAPDMLIERQVTGCRYALPCSHLIPLKTQDTPPYGNRITIFPTRDNDGIRMIALSAFFAWNRFAKVLVNGGACINCLIDTCHLTQCNYIIL